MSHLEVQHHANSIHLEMVLRASNFKTCGTVFSSIAFSVLGSQGKVAAEVDFRVPQQTGFDEFSPSPNFQVVSTGLYVAGEGV